ncbi:hypothetical protein LCGC14_1778040 [marine sediment metagenome]|uniref:Uncharacterized protein n=1 Tax=marine sediment metagenome TaxID=412755 RepID=A0A0F9JB53_9ZZZZ
MKRAVLIILIALLLYSCINKSVPVNNPIPDRKEFRVGGPIPGLTNSPYPVGVLQFYPSMDGSIVIAVQHWHSTVTQTHSYNEMFLVCKKNYRYGDTPWFSLYDYVRDTVYLDNPTDGIIDEIIEGVIEKGLQIDYGVPECEVKV